MCQVRDLVEPGDDRADARKPRHEPPPPHQRPRRAVHRRLPDRDAFGLAVRPFQRQRALDVFEHVPALGHVGLHEFVHQLRRFFVGADAHRRIAADRHQRDQPEIHVDVEHHRQDHAREQPVDTGRDRFLDDQVAYVANMADARGKIVDAARAEKGVAEPEQMVDDLGRGGHIGQRADAQQQFLLHYFGARDDDHQQRRIARDFGDGRGEAAGHHLVDQAAGPQRHHDEQDLRQQRDGDGQRNRAFEMADIGQELPQRPASGPRMRGPGCGSPRTRRQCRYSLRKIPAPASAAALWRDRRG